jgi:hypothetical protein
MEQDPAKAFHLFVQGSPAVFAGENLQDRRTEEPGEGGHADGQFPGIADDGDPGMEKFMEQRRNLFRPLFVGLEAALFRDPGEAGRQSMLSPYIPAEFQIVRQDQVVQALAVALQLFFPFDHIERLPHVFGFDVADGHTCL